MSKLTDTIFQKEMNRRDFLRYMGSLLLAIIGVTNLLHTLKQHNTQQSHLGYGGGTYGGKK